MSDPEVLILDIDRVLVATDDLEESASSFENLLGLSFGATVDPPGEPVANRTSQVGLEFVSGENGSAIESFLGTNGPGLYALSLEVADADAAREALAKRGVEPIDEMAFEGFRELFYHPSSFEGVLLVLTEYDRPHPAESAAEAAGWTQGEDE
ncbi:VOC family protein [Natrinema gelatinilyticum]|uniref:VOC family protein n=1 Tax=Natrinema gelatinilyticum TaxID=2961571 RepID=UPI0020C33A6C|nr:VOC family protein [Natrinema gelatinilyticum]